MGNDAWKVEVEVLKWLRKELKYPQHLTLEQMPRTGGQSETVSADSITVLELQKKVEQVLKHLKNRP